MMRSESLGFERVFFVCVFLGFSLTSCRVTDFTQRPGEVLEVLKRIVRERSAWSLAMLYPGREDTNGVPGMGSCSVTF